MVNFTEVMLDNKGSTGHTSDPDALKRTPLSRVFHDARLMDAVLVLESFQIEMFLIGEGGGSASAGDGSFKLMLDMLLYDMERFPGVVIMVVTSRVSLDLVTHRSRHPPFDRVCCVDRVPSFLLCCCVSLAFPVDFVWAVERLPVCVGVVFPLL